MRRMSKCHDSQVTWFPEPFSRNSLHLTATEAWYRDDYESKSYWRKRMESLKAHWSECETCETAMIAKDFTYSAKVFWLFHDDDKCPTCLSKFNEHYNTDYGYSPFEKRDRTHYRLSKRVKRNVKCPVPGSVR